MNTNTYATDNYNIDAEQAVLGTIIISSKNAISILQELSFLKAKHFYNREHKIIFEIIKECESMKQNVDVITILTEVRRMKIDTSLINKAFLDNLIYQTTLLSDPAKTAVQLLDLYKRREIEKEIQNFKHMETDSFTSNIGNLADNIEVKNFDDCFLPTNQLLDKYMSEKADKKQFFKTEFTGFFELDKTTKKPTQKSGLKIPQTGLIAIVARPKVGKTTIALQLAKKLSNEAKIAFFSLEMTTTSILNKYLALPTQKTTGVNPLKLSSSEDETEIISDSTTKHINQAISEFEENSIKFAHGVFDIDQIIAQMRAGKRRGLNVFFIDQLSKIAYYERAKSTKEKYDYMIQKLSEFCKLENILIVLVAQCNREVNSRDNKLPQDSDVMDTDRLLQEVDTILIGNWKDEYDTSNWLIINRHAHGQRGLLKWNKSLAIYEGIN